MNNKEIAYQKTLNYVFKHRCHYCGCTPKNDEWAGENPNICIDCKTDEE
jgi:hypothetical protein